METTSDDLPEFLAFSSQESEMRIYSKNLTDIGFYKFRVNAVLDNLGLLENVDGDFSVTIDPANPPSDLIYQASFEIVIEMYGPEVLDSQSVDNSDPFFLPTPKDLWAYIGQAFSHSFGPAIDFESDSVKDIRVDIDLGLASQFASFDYSTNTIMIEEGATD